MTTLKLIIMSTHTQNKKIFLWTAYSVRTNVQNSLISFEWWGGGWQTVVLEVLLFTITACVQINVTLQQYYFQITQVSAKCLLVPSTNRQITIKSPANSPWRWLGAMTECHHVGGTRRCSTQRRHIQRFFSPEKHKLWPATEIVDDSNHTFLNQTAHPNFICDGSVYICASIFVFLNVPINLSPAGSLLFHRFLIDN